jgi:hypothetical protein
MEAFASPACPCAVSTLRLSTPSTMRHLLLLLLQVAAATLKLALFVSR